MSLLCVYFLMAIHIAHWYLAGRTLAPLEMNEVLYTLELGIVTAGFILMSLAVVSTALCGRFFCSWGCHILALQDLCAWLLSRARIRPKPVRSRILLLVPVLAMGYMFILPHIVRAVDRRPIPQFRVTSDGDGWSSFITSDFWRNLPGPGVSIATLAVCGFAMVYVLGSRGFCTYVCPYGAIFAAADRLAIGRIKAVGEWSSCETCGLCTAACDSHIRVHQELTVFGRVVSPACLKDLDCVAACPQGLIAFGIARPSGLLSWRKWGRFGVPYDFSWQEDLAMAMTFIAALASLRGLYDTIPFFLSMGMSVVLAYGAVLTWRAWSRRDVRLNNLMLKRGGRLTPAGIALSFAATGAAVTTAHCGFIRWHEVAGARGFNSVASRLAQGDRAPSAAEVSEVLGHLETCRRWGALHPPALSLRLATAYCWIEDPTHAEPHVRDWLAAHPEDHAWRLMLAAMLISRNEPCEAEYLIMQVLAETNDDPLDAPSQLRQAAHAMLSDVRMAASAPHPPAP